jgi:hypothetical protein
MRRGWVLSAVVLGRTALLVSCSRTGNTIPEQPTPVVTVSGTQANAGSTVHLTEYSTNDGPRASLILTGAISDYGHAVSTNPDGTVNLEHNAHLKLVMTDGSFRLNMAGLDQKVVEASATLNPIHAPARVG